METNKIEAINKLNKATALLINEGPSPSELLEAFMHTHLATQQTLQFKVQPQVETRPGAFMTVVDRRDLPVEFTLSCVIVQLGYVNANRTAFYLMAYVMSDACDKVVGVDELVPLYDGSFFTEGCLISMQYNAASGEGVILHVSKNDGNGYKSESFITVPGVGDSVCYRADCGLARPADYAAVNTGFAVHKWLREARGAQSGAEQAEAAQGAQVAAEDSENNSEDMQEDAEQVQAQDQSYQTGAVIDEAIVGQAMIEPDEQEPVKKAPKHAMLNGADGAEASSTKHDKVHAAGLTGKTQRRNRAAAFQVK